MDTVGPLSNSRFQGKTCKHLLTILDGFTRYLTAIPIPDLEARTLLKGFMEGFVLVHGLPEVVHTDNGSSLVGKLFQDSLNQMGIQTTRTPVYTPQGNRVERTHRTLGGLLRANDEINPHSWTSNLQTIVFEINNARNKITGVSPYYGMYGRNVRLPLDVCFPQGLINPGITKTWDQYIINLSKTFEQIHCSMARHEKVSIPVDSSIKSPRNPRIIKVGDTVYYFSPRGVINLSRKLTPRWSGPYRVVQTLSPSLSIIYPLGDWAISKKEICTPNTKLKVIDLALTRPEPTREPIDLNDLPEPGDSDSGEITFNLGTKETGEGSINPSTDSDSDSDANTLSRGDTPSLIEPPFDRRDPLETPRLEKGLEIIPPDEGFNSQPTVTGNIKLNHKVTAPDSIIDGELIGSPLETRILPVTYETPKRKRNKRALPEPREPRVRREAFESALDQLAKTLKRKKELKK